MSSDSDTARVAILHYSAPPIVGGVETTIERHAGLLAAAGWAVQVVAGRGRTFHPDVAFLRVPEMDSRHPRVLAVKEELDRGEISAAFLALRDRLAAELRPVLAQADICIGHNLFTLHKNLALTAALHQLWVQEGAELRLLAWHHDLAWRRRQYAPDLHPGYPWDLLRQPWPRAVNVTVSEPRRRELSSLLGIRTSDIAVVPPGVDARTFLGWGKATEDVVQTCGLLAADLILLLPARITPRKNIELAIETVGALRQQTGMDARLVVTGPPGPHNPANADYLSELLTLRQGLGLLDAVHFLYQLGSEDKPLIPDSGMMRDLYGLADALLFPSREEGFGIPILEAALVRLPIFCARIPPLKVTGGNEARYFSPGAPASEVADLIRRHLLSDPAFRLRRRVLEQYTWERVFRNRILPLLRSETGIG